MKSAVILGAGQMGKAAAALLNAEMWEILAFGDNGKQTWNTDAPVPVLPVEEALARNPETVILALKGENRCAELMEQITALGYTGPVLRFSDVMDTIDIRTATLRRLAERITHQQLPGDVAELGVYQGSFARQINALFPEKKLFLFDTFEGFARVDIQAEQEKGNPRAKAGDFSDVSLEEVLEKMPFPDRIEVRKGFFPQTAERLETSFCLVNLDADLYAPTLAGLQYFYPRLVRGGVILLHDYNSAQYSGVKTAVQEFEQQKGPLLMVPLCDLHGTAVIIRD